MLQRILALGAICIVVSATPSDAQIAKMYDTSLRENGRSIRLEIFLHKPPGPGPHPLAVVNHGSTGPCNRQISPKQVWAPIRFARYFVEKGLAVAYPQRRGRGGSEGAYDPGFGPDRAGCGSCLPAHSLPAFDRGIGDVHAAIEALGRDRQLDTTRLLQIGFSRGGAIAVGYAGKHPRPVIGVVNFVGGWMGVACPAAFQANKTALLSGAKYPRSMLWLYGTNDPLYGPRHTRGLYQAFRKAGGRAQFELLPANHFLINSPNLWTPLVDKYLREVTARRRR